MKEEDNKADYQVGYRQPPASTRFRKGQSGNPQGRPPGRRKDLPFEAVLGQIVTIREGDTERRVTAAEAFLLHLTKHGLEGDAAAARLALEAIGDARLILQDREADAIKMVVVMVAPGSVNLALEPLRMAKKLDRYRKTARIMLEPWIVEEALARLSVPLSVEDQRTIVHATRTPKKVRWPTWWAANL